MNLPSEFRKLKRYYDDNEFDQIFNHELGVHFLKMRSISRSVLLREVADKQGIDISNVETRKLFPLMFRQQISNSVIDSLIRQVYQRERAERIQNEDYLYSQLYKLKVFDWGGFYQNAVEQTIVNNYVKTTQDYDKLCDAIENDINPRLRGYVLCSWYNHWTSILIEDMFKDHPDLLPTVGLIKKVDFFWKDFPFDLKVTYFPDEFMKRKRKESGLKPELTELKRFARKHDIYYDRNAKDRGVFTELITKISEDISEDAKEFISNLHHERREIILETTDRPRDLVKWLYENQGVRRFDAANRFFLILVNLRNLEESWKLKRNKKLLKDKITSYLDENQDIDFEQFRVKFSWQDREYTAYATTLFIIVE